MRLAGAAAVLVLLAGTTVACGDDSPAVVDHSRLIDDRGGSYSNISIGDPAAEVRRRFGAPDPADRDEECDLCPVGTTDADRLGQPTFVAAPQGERRVRVMRYRDVVFLIGGDRVYGFLVTDPAAATSRGAGIGHALTKARERYHELDCDVANRGDGDLEFPFCAGRVTRLYLSFGGDPIRSVTVSSTPLQE